MSSKYKIQFEQTNDRDESAGISIDEDGRRCVQLHEWDMNKMHPWGVDDTDHGSKIVVIGKPGTGKSKIIESILLYKAHICPVSQIFSGTESVNHFYSKMCTDVSIHDKLDKADLKPLENFIKRQDIATKYLKNPWAIQILDDVTDDPSMFNKPVFNAIFKRGRHYRGIFAIVLQNSMDAKVAMRTCIDYLFILSNPSVVEREKMYKNFGTGIIPTFQDFCDLMDQLGDYEALIFDNTSASGRLQDRVFYYKADINRIPSQWKFGSPDAWAFNNARLDPSYQPSFL